MAAAFAERDAAAARKEQERMGKGLFAGVDDLGNPDEDEKEADNDTRATTRSAAPQLLLPLCAAGAWCHWW